NGVDGYLHTSGHAYKDEHIKIFNLTRPKYFMPYHGEYRMSVVHGYTASECGVAPENVVVANLGDVYYLENHKMRLADEKVYFGPVFIDGNILSKTNAQIMKERMELGQNGFLNVIVALNKEKNLILGKPRVVSRGAFFVKNSLHLIEEVKRIVHGAVLYTIKNSNDWTVPQLKQLIIDRLAPFFYKQKRRNVVIIPTFLFADRIQAVDEEKIKSKENKKVKTREKSAALSKSKKATLARNKRKSVIINKKNDLLDNN
ncbi:MBL fold metallo-hydrolase RNA specificity domain-containing protein, partial [Metamycoplasma equirhinis]